MTWLWILTWCQNQQPFTEAAAKKQTMLTEEWVWRHKFQPSLWGHLRRRHVPDTLIRMQRRCAHAIRTQRDDDDDSAIHRLRTALDMHIGQVVRRAYVKLNDLYQPMIRCRLWRRLILWGRARVAARRVLLRRTTSCRERVNVDGSVDETVCV